MEGKWKRKKLSFGCAVVVWQWKEIFFFSYCFVCIAFCVVLHWWTDTETEKCNGEMNAYTHTRKRCKNSSIDVYTILSIWTTFTDCESTDASKRKKKWYETEQHNTNQMRTKKETKSNSIDSSNTRQTLRQAQIFNVIEQRTHGHGREEKKSGKRRLSHQIEHQTIRLSIIEEKRAHERSIDRTHRIKVCFFFSFKKQ